MAFSLEDIKLLHSGTLDSRVKGSAGNPVKQHSQANLERTFCVMCTKPMGWVSTGDYEFIRLNKVICVCDDCVFTHGTPPLKEAEITEIKDIKNTA